LSAHLLTTLVYLVFLHSLPRFCTNDEIQSGITGKGAGWLVQLVTTTSGAAKHYKFNELIGSQQLSLKTASAGDLLIGVEQNLYSKVQMDLAEAVVYDRALTSSERVLLVNHLLEKYGL
jgi:hypothetical protein